MNFENTRMVATGRADQVEVMQVLLDKRIATRHGIMNAHQEPAWVGRTDHVPLPVWERRRDQRIFLRLHHWTPPDEAGCVVDTFANSCGTAFR